MDDVYHRDVVFKEIEEMQGSQFRKAMHRGLTVGNRTALSFQRLGVRGGRTDHIKSLVSELMPKDGKGRTPPISLEDRESRVRSKSK